MNFLEPTNQGAYSFFSFQCRQHPELAGLMQGLGALGSYWALLIILAWAMWLLRWRRVGNLGLMTTVAAIAVVEILRRFIPRKRPPEAFDRVGAEEMLRGFPSGPVLLSCVIFYLAAIGWAEGHPRSRRLGYILAVLGVVAIAVSQLWLSLHYLTDILAGIFGGLGLVFFLARQENAMRKPPLAA